MSSASEAFVTPTVLRWARTRAGAPRELLAKQLNTKPESIADWENGQTRPTFRQAEKLAAKLQIPFGYLFLEEPPEEQIPLPDFRTLRSEVISSPTPEFIDLLYDVLAKHLWYKELLRGEDRSELRFVASFGISDRTEDIASSISDVLGLDDEFRRSCGSWEQFLRGLVRKAEDAGILVMRAGTVAGNPHRKVSVKEFRGFAISDRLAPLIYVNGGDSKAAQIFTVAHELAHIWVGETGISNESLRQPDTGPVEEVCNAVAAEVLAPARNFRGRWSGSASVDDNVHDLGGYFRVSSLVVLRRAYDLELISRRTFSAHYRAEEERFEGQSRRQRDGGNYYATLLTRNSETFTHAVVEAVATGKALYTEAARLLNVRVPTIPKVAEYLKKGRGSD